MSTITPNTIQKDNQVVFKNLTSVHLECLIEHPGSERVGCLNKVIGTFLQRIPVAPESVEESVTLLAPGQAFRPKSQSPGQRWLFRERFSGKLLFSHQITPESGREQYFQLQSQEREEEVETLFSNETTLELELTWVDFDGRERLMQTLAPGETYKRHTFVNHVWLARDMYSKIPLDIIVIDPLEDTYPIRSDHLVSRPGAEKVNMVFKNVTPIPLTFNWVGPEGEEITKFSLGPGEFTKEGMNTRVGHVWRVRGGSENEEIKLVLPSVKKNQFYEVKLAEFEGNPATEVTFVNETMLDVDLFLVGSAGEHFRFKGLSPKESFVQATFATHKWLVREARTEVLLATFTAQTAPTTVHINSSHVRSQPDAPPTRVRFANHSPFIIRVVSIGPEGQKSELEELLPDQGGSEHESNDHVWRFIDDMTGREISQFIARPGETLQHEIVVRSIHSRSPASITVHNETHLSVDVFWLNYEGQEQHMQTLATGAACTMDTFLTHPWLVRDARSGHLLESIFGQMAAQQINITDGDLISYHRGGQTKLKVTNSLPFSVELYALSEERDESDSPLTALAPNDDIQLDVQTGVVLRARQRRSQQLIANLIPKEEADEFELKLRAVHSHFATEIEFVNESPLTVKLCRVDLDGNEHEEDTLKPFDFVVRDTFATHPWIVRDENSDVPVANTIGLSRPQTLRIKADHLYHMQRPDAKMVKVKFTNGSRIALDVFQVDTNGREHRLFTTRPLAPGSVEDFFRFDINSLIPQDRTFPAGSIFRAYKAGTRQLADIYILNDTDGQTYTLRNKLVREGLRASGELREGEVALFSEENFQGKAWIARTDVPFFRDLGDADDVEDIANDILGDIEDFFRPLTEFFDELFLSDEEKERRERERAEKEAKFFKSLDNRISSIRVGPNTQAIIFSAANFKEGKNDVILMDAANLSQTDVGDNQISSLKIVTTAGALETNIRSTATLSEEYLVEEDATGKKKLVRDTTGAPLTFPVYRCVISLPPDVDEVDVWATEALTIDVEGQKCLGEEKKEVPCNIDPVKSARFKPNAAQKLLINIKATGMGTPALQLRTNTMRERDRFLVFPDQDVSRKLAALQPGQMWRDRAQLGLPEGLSEKDVDHLQYAVQTVAGAAGYRDDTSRREGRYILTDNMEYGAWSLDFSGDGPSYKPLSDSALADLTAGAKLMVDDGIPQDFFGDAWNATKQGAHAVGEGTVATAKKVDRVVVKPVAKTTVGAASTVDEEVLQPTVEFTKKEILDPVNDNVIQPAKEVVEEEVIEPVRRDVIEPAAEFVEEEIIDPVVENVEKAKEDIEAFVQEALAVTIQAGETLNTVIVDTPEKALALSEHLLTELGVAAEDVVEWLEDTFDWDDILAVHDVFHDLLDQMLTQVQEVWQTRPEQLGGALESVEGKMMEVLENMGAPDNNEALSGTKSVSTADFTVDFSDKLDWLMNKILEAGPVSLPGLTAESEALEELMALMDTFGSTVASQLENSSDLLEQTVNNLLQRLDQVFSAPDQLGSHLFTEILGIIQGLVSLGFDLVEAVLQLMSQLVVAALSLLRTISNAILEIPFVSELYAEITGGHELSLLNLTALALALPVGTVMESDAAHSLLENISLPMAEGDEEPQSNPIAVAYISSHFVMTVCEPATRWLALKEEFFAAVIMGVLANFSGLLAQGCAYPLSFNNDKFTLGSTKSDNPWTAPTYWGSVTWFWLWVPFCLGLVDYARLIGRAAGKKLNDKTDEVINGVSFVFSVITILSYFGLSLSEGERNRQAFDRPSPFLEPPAPEATDDEIQRWREDIQDKLQDDILEWRPVPVPGATDKEDKPIDIDLINKWYSGIKNDIQAWSDDHLSEAYRIRLTGYFFDAFPALAYSLSELTKDNRIKVGGMALGGACHAVQAGLVWHRNAQGQL